MPSGGQQLATVLGGVGYHLRAAHPRPVPVNQQRVSLVGWIGRALREARDVRLAGEAAHVSREGRRGLTARLQPPLVARPRAEEGLAVVVGDRRNDDDREAVVCGRARRPRR